MSSGLWYLRDVATPANDLLIPVIDDVPYDKDRPATAYQPLNGGPEVVIYAKTPSGRKGHLKIFWATPNTQASMEAAILAFLALDTGVKLDNAFGDTPFFIRFPKGMKVTKDMGQLTVEFDYTETSS